MYVHFYAILFKKTVKHKKSIIVYFHTIDKKQKAGHCYDHCETSRKSEKFIFVV